MKIACLGSGSLVWDSRELPVIDGWRNDGPALPLEFARQSADNRLTLVIVEGAVFSETLWALLGVQTLAEAISALAKREGTRDQRMIGRWPSSPGQYYPETDRIAKWAAQRQVDAVVWTALPPGMKSSRGVTPNLTELTAHLRSLDEVARANAKEYVSKAPAQIKTRFRDALQAVLSSGSTA